MLFRWAEERTQLTIDWYLWRKSSRARWSKAFRGAAILFGVAGGLTPLVHSVSAAAPAPEWGFVLLGLSGGSVLFDKIFGFSSSWTRFMRTQADLQSELALAQMRYLDWLSKLPEGPAVSKSSAAELHALTRVLIDKTTTAVLRETASWADDLSVQMDQANSRFVVGSPNGPMTGPGFLEGRQRNGASDPAALTQTEPPPVS